MFIQLGFPECCFERHNFDHQNITADGTPLDIIPALLTMAFYPNIYYYKGKRKVIYEHTLFLILKYDATFQICAKSTRY